MRRATPSPQPAQTSAQEPLATFRARFHSRRAAYVTVHVFPTAAALRAYAHATRPDSPKGHYFGLASSWTRTSFRTGHARLTPDYGDILLCCRHLDAETLAHECAHIALGYAERHRLRLLPRTLGQADHAEEVFCGALGGLLAHVVAGLRDAGLLVTAREARRRPTLR